jgi:hypothetical protein
MNARPLLGSAGAGRLAAAGRWRKFRAAPGRAGLYPNGPAF